jgi:hypothetical protein
MKTKRMETQQIGNIKCQKLGRTYYATIALPGLPGMPTLKSVGTDKKTVLNDIRQKFNKKRRSLQLA